MNLLLFIPIVAVIVIIMVAVIIIGIKSGKEISGTKIMLFSIQVTLIIGIIILQQEPDLGAIPYILIIVALITSAIGLEKKD